MNDNSQLSQRSLLNVPINWRSIVALILQSYADEAIISGEVAQFSQTLIDFALRKRPIVHVGILR